MNKSIITLIFTLFLVSCSITKSYYENGVIKNSGNYVNEQKNGIWKYYYENGNLKIKGKYSKGIPISKWTYYYKNGNIEKTGKFSEDEWKPFMNNRMKAPDIQVGDYLNKTGEWREYFDTGVLKSIGSYKGSKIGTWKEFYENGNIKSEYTFGTKVRIIEKWTKYYENGRIKTVSYEPSGKREYYYRNGNIKEIAIPLESYKDSIIKKYEYKYFDKEGKSISQSKSNEFLEIMKSKKIITLIYSNLEKEIINDRSVDFKAQNIRNDSINILEYNNAIHQTINYLIDVSVAEIRNEYSMKNIDDIEQYIKIAKTEQNFQKVLEQTGYKKNANELVNNHFSDIKRTIRLTLENLKAKNTPLKLRIVIDYDTVPYSKTNGVELFLKTSNPKYKKIDVYDNDSGTISLPKDLKNSEIISVIIKYMENEYEFFEDRFPEYSKDFRKSVRETLDPLSEYCFESLTHWDLIIVNNPKNNSDLGIYKPKEGFNPDKKYRLLIRFKTRVETYTYL